MTPHYPVTGPEAAQSDADTMAALGTSVPAFLPAARPSFVQIGLMMLGTVAFLYFARPVILPVFLACLAGMTLKPLIGWLSRWYIPMGVSAAIVLSILVMAAGVGFSHLGQPASQWINDTPLHMTQLRQRFQKLFPRAARLGEATAAVKDLGATKAEMAEQQHQVVAVEVQDNRGTTSLLNWTGTFLVGTGETLVLLYLLLSSGDLFTQKLVRVMPTLRDKKRAVEINREIQQNISHYLLSVSLINLGLGAVTGAGLYFMGIPNAAMWGLVVAILNYVPYFGPVVVVASLATVGLLSFDSLPRGLLACGWYLVLHLLEANILTPVLLGRRFALNPVVIFVSLIFWTWMWGIPGALLSVPVLVSVKVICDHLPSLSSVSELLTS